MKEEHVILFRKAIDISKQAHFGQVDKSGQDYIKHPAFVAALIGEEYPIAMIVAMLHDVIEDSDFTKEDLKKAGLPNDIINCVNRLSKKHGEEYNYYLRRVKNNSISLIVKCADAFHNSMVSRYPNPTPKQLEKSEIYYRRYLSLLELAKKKYPNFALLEGTKLAESLSKVTSYL